MFGHDPESGLRAVIAIHNSARGPGLGGLRMRDYASEHEALADVLRLSRGMSYKNAMAGLPHGGGKAVILGDPETLRTPSLMRAMGRLVESLGGRYITAQDSGVRVEDLRQLAQTTAHVTGLKASRGPDGEERTGDPSPATAVGVYHGIRACLEAVFGSGDPAGRSIAIQGVGSVGLRLAQALHAAGARLLVADIHAGRAQDAADRFGAEVLPVASIHAAQVDVFAPCALGGAINGDTIDGLRARIVAGAANNQLARPEFGAALRNAGILYAPDYVINAGGVIDVAAQLGNYRPQQVHARVVAIADTLRTIFREATSNGLQPEQVADRLAEQRMRQPSA
nr:Glu/Leu/Phe/Val dehydrogenase dimerization domain-containing protein [Methylonatrum kenyense]